MGCYEFLEFKILKVFVEIIPKMVSFFKVLQLFGIIAFTKNHTPFEAWFVVDCFFLDFFKSSIELIILIC